MSANGIRAARRHAGLTQQGLASAADCSLSYVRLLEAGFKPAHSDVLPRVARALGLLPPNKVEARADNADLEKSTDAGGHHEFYGE